MPSAENVLLGEKSFPTAEIVLGLVGAVGAELKITIDHLVTRLQRLGYSVRELRISSDVIPIVAEIKADHSGSEEFKRIMSLMDAGDHARQTTDNNSILAFGVAAKISSERNHQNQKHRPKTAYIINSLKHPSEVETLRAIYPLGFHLIGVHSSKERREKYLATKGVARDEISRLIDRDENENLEHGQRTSDTFHLSDFFVNWDGHQDRLRNSIYRITDILFGSPYLTPTFDEYSMYMAFAASLRSADMSRQVGAVITREHEILATGANDCPKYGGGLYWPLQSKETCEVSDHPQGRDHTRGIEANKEQIQSIINEIVDNADFLSNPEPLRRLLLESSLSDITEYGRVVHAEMEAILSCARRMIDTRGSTLFCTTFPCHNCAKHIVAAGIERVVFDRGKEV